jgi:type I restriction enzyme, S subunit
MNAKTVPLEDVCEFIRDGTHSSPERVPNGIPVLSAEHVRDGGLSFDTDRFTSDKELAVFRRRLHPLPGDVLMTIVGTIGRVGILRHDLRNL